jgi:ribosome maturation factor RimP
VESADRRIEGVLIGADETTATVQVEDPATGMPVEQVVELSQIDRARTVFVWGPTPKPGGKKPASKKAGAKKAGAKKAGSKKTTAQNKIEEQKESS